MCDKKEKGQISIEVLLILSVLIIGSVLVGTFYFSQIRSKSNSGDEFSGLMDNFMDELNPNSAHCGNSVCELELGEDNGNCSTDCYCGDGFCIPGFEQPGDSDISPSCKSDCDNVDAVKFKDLNLTLIPDSSTKIDNNFKIKVSVTSTYAIASIGKLEVLKNDGGGYLPSNSCSFNGVYDSVFNDIGFLYPSTVAGYIEKTFVFSCKEPGAYKFIFSKINPKGEGGFDLGGDIEKTITLEEPTDPNTLEDFIINITSPKEGDSFFVNSSILLRAEDFGLGTTEKSLSCSWYIGEKAIDTDSQCDFNYTYPDALGFGEKKVVVYATKDSGNKSGADKVLYSTDSVTINIYKNTNSLLLSLDSQNQYVDQEFYIKAFSTDKDKINLIDSSKPNITFKGAECDITSSDVLEGTDAVSGINVYYKKIPVNCLTGNYVTQTELGTVSAELESSTVDFFVSHNLTMGFANCNFFGSAHTTMNVCAFPKGGFSYNSDYWNNAYDGFLTVSVSLPNTEFEQNETSDVLGEYLGLLTAYVSD